MSAEADAERRKVGGADFIWEMNLMAGRREPTMGGG